MSAMRASRKPSSSNTRLAASTSRARVSAPLRERGAVGSLGAAEARTISGLLEARAQERQALRIGGDLVERGGDELGRDVGLVRGGSQRVEVEPVQLGRVLAEHHAYLALGNLREREPHVLARVGVAALVMRIV